MAAVSVRGDGDGRGPARVTELQAEVFFGNAGALTKVFERFPSQSIAFPHGRQINELRGSTASTPEVYEAGSEFGNANGALRIAVVSSATDEFSQSGHLGEG